jgi:colicin import membrane protein
MRNTPKSKAEQKYQELQKKDLNILSDIEKANKLRTEKVARLRALRLNKEAEDKKAEVEKAAKGTAKAKSKTDADPKKAKSVRRVVFS